jgi:NAD(P)-dependent dehydrogenase (short-subunit alcohol dehydrogenase family)
VPGGPNGGAACLISRIRPNAGRRVAWPSRDRLPSHAKTGQVDLPGVTPNALDIADLAPVAAAVKANGDVTVLTNNAGSSTGADPLAADLCDIRLEIDTRFFGTVLAVRAFAPQILAIGGGAILMCLRLVLDQRPGYQGLLCCQVHGVVAYHRSACTACRPGYSSQ